MIESKLKEHFGLNNFLQGQKEVIELIVKGESAGAIFPTGAGKSLCYQLSAVLLPGITLVVSPLLSLMKDQIEFLQRKNIKAAKLDSTLTKEEYNKVLNDAKTGQIKILIISVERFKNERFRIQLKQMQISLLVVDEAHCISEWGHNFRPDYLKIPYYKSEYNIEQILLLTATATPKVTTDMCDKFKIPMEHIVITGFYRENLFLKVRAIDADEKESLVLDIISKNPDDSTIVYVTLQKTAEEVAHFLINQGYKALPYHAGMDNAERELVQNKFMDGSASIIVATIAFGMGIDKKDIRKVVHYDLPKSIENYSQEIGRAGRDGLHAQCEVLANLDNVTVLENFIYGDTPEKVSIEKFVKKIKNCESDLLEIKEYSLSYELNIRMLPLKTLLVYLEIKNIIKSKFTYFEDYEFKYLKESSDIVKEFIGERKRFVKNIFEHSETAKIWTKPDFNKINKSYKVDRERIIKALEYFDEKGWIELRARKSVDVYEILNKGFEVCKLSNSLFNIFKEKEENEINRISNMIQFFESDACLSNSLSLYFGETINKRCNHCSFCENGKIRLQYSSELKPLLDIYFKDLIRDLLKETQNYSLSNLTITKFLCGINTPFISRMKLSKINGYGSLKNYPFLEVKSLVEKEFHR
ncbi:MAG: RecQ family ATP-dependent DNA helicase [Pseudomonadota bacterium]